MSLYQAARFLDDPDVTRLHMDWVACSERARAKLDSRGYWDALKGKRKAGKQQTMKRAPVNRGPKK